MTTIGFPKKQVIQHHHLSAGTEWGQTQSSLKKACVKFFNNCQKTWNSHEPSFHGCVVFTWIAPPSNSPIIRSSSYTITWNVEYLPLSATRGATAMREPVAGERYWLWIATATRIAAPQFAAIPNAWSARAKIAPHARLLADCSFRYNPLRRVHSHHVPRLSPFPAIG